MRIVNERLASIALALIFSLSSAAGFGQANCSYIIAEQWGDGFTGAIRITNTAQTAIQGWQVSWQYQTNAITNSWNAQVSGNNPYSASDLGWNGAIEPGQSVEFGFQGVTNGGSVDSIGHSVRRE